MDSILDNVSVSLFNGQLPSEWRRLAPATNKSLGGWMEHFLHRISQYNQWVSEVFCSGTVMAFIQTCDTQC